VPRSGERGAAHGEGDRALGLDHGRRVVQHVRERPRGGRPGAARAPAERSTQAGRPAPTSRRTKSPERAVIGQLAPAAARSTTRPVGRGDSRSSVSAAKKVPVAGVTVRGLARWARGSSASPPRGGLRPRGRARASSGSRKVAATSKVKARGAPRRGHVVDVEARVVEEDAGAERFLSAARVDVGPAAADVAHREVHRDRLAGLHAAVAVAPARRLGELPAVREHRALQAPHRRAQRRHVGGHAPVRLAPLQADAVGAREGRLGHEAELARARRGSEVLPGRKPSYSQMPSGSSRCASRRGSPGRRPARGSRRGGCRSWSWRAGGTPARCRGWSPSP
jgi:hypothetical protein